MSWHNFKDKLKRYFPFSDKEKKDFLITVAVMAFIFSFNKWGIEKFNLSYGIKNLLISIGIVAVSLFAHHAAQRATSLYYGFRTEHKLWYWGLGIGFVLAVLTNGQVLFLAASGITIHLLTVHRLGFFRYGPNVEVLGKVAASGIGANLVLAGIGYGIASLAGTEPMNSFVVFNLLFAAWNILPIPPLDGSIILPYSRAFYYFIIGTIASYFFLLLVGINSLLFAIILGFIFFVFAWAIEKGYLK